MHEHLLSAPIVGFDVFDTLITRALGDPTDVFWYVGTRLQQEGILSVPPAAYRRIRIWSERLGRRFVEGHEIRLEEILSGICRGLGLPLEYIGKLRFSEMAEEKRWIRPVSEMVAILSERRTRGLTSVLVSDTYLSRSDVQELLTLCGLEVDAKNIFVSSEYRCNKTSQGLFRKVFEQYHVKAADFVFVGDNFTSDVQAPRMMNASAFHFLRTRPTRYEAVLSSFRQSTRGLSCAMAGASRQARLAIRDLDARREALVRVAAGVIGPVMTAYVTWVLRDASRRRLKRLYFLSREGQLLQAMACRLAPKLGIDVECRYLYASRQAWRLPAICTMGDFERRWIFETHGRLTLKEIAGRIEANPGWVADCACRVGIDPGNLERDLSKAEVESLKRVFDGPEMATVLEHAYMRRQETLAYLEQEGLFDGTSWGIVDVGWEASLQRCLDSLVRFRGQGVKLGYYFGLRRFAPYGAPDSHHQAFLFDDRMGRGVWERPFQVVPLIETFLRADHGMTLRYEQQDGRMVPVLRDDKTQRVIDWGVRDIHQAVLAFVDEFLPLVADPPMFEDMPRRMVASLLKTFWETPVADEAQAWGSYPFGADQTGEHWQSLASPMEPSVWMDALLGKHLPRRHPNQWMLGSAAISTPLSALLTRTVYKMAKHSRQLHHLTEFFRPRAYRRRRAIVGGRE